MWIHCTVYDMTMGTSQMLTCMEERLKQLDSKATVQTFGQESTPLPWEFSSGYHDSRW